VTAPQREDGAVIVEFAAVFIVFITLLWGLVGYGAIFAVQQSMEHAAAEATRAAIGMADEASAVTRAEEVANDQLSWLGTPGQVDTSATGDDTIQVVDCYTNARCLEVDLTYDWGTDPLVPSLFDIAMPDTLTARAVIQFSE
jgi:Flp pilus assembly protein TadG